MCDDWLFCVLKDGLTAVEHTLLRHGDDDMVRTVRLRFQEQMREDFTGVVQRLTGHQVLTYHSQVVFDPDFSLEIFLLGPPVDDGDDR